MNKNIITLTGFMGSGKSYISKILARELGYKLIDTDEQIVKNQGKSIPQIMSEVGEQGFRQIEKEVIADLLNYDFLVLSVGGGAILHNADLLMNGSTVVFLDTDFKVCYERIKNDKNRPLAFGKTYDQVFDIYSQRLEKYQKNCHLSIKNDDGNQIVKKIKEFLKNY